MPVDAIDPLQLRPVVGPTDDLKYYWSFDNQWTASPIVEDFNNDGLDDFIWLQSNYRTGTNSYDQDGQQWPTYPFLYYESNGDGTFAEKTQQLFPGGQYIGMSASRYIFDDLDGDSINDLLILDQGYESIEAEPLRLPDLMVGDVLLDNNGDPWTQEVIHQGAPLVWWKGSLGNPYQSKIIGQDYLAFHHNGAAGDIDLDGQKEIFVANAGSYLEVTNSAISQWFDVNPSNNLLYGGAIATRIEDSEIMGAGFRPIVVLDFDSEINNFVLDFNLLPDDASRQIMLNAQGGFQEMLPVSTTALDDINADGLLDLIVGIGVSYEGGPLANRIYLNENGSFASSSPYSLPFPSVASNFENRNSAVFIDTADIDGNGLIDIAMGYENPGNGDGAGHFIQLWSQTADMQFEDVTLDAIGSYDTTVLLDDASYPFGSSDTWGGGPSWLRFEDINNDGHLDIAMFTQLVGFYELGGAFLINDGAGHFAPLHHSNFTAPQQRNNISYPDQAAGNYQAIVGDFNGDELTDTLVIEYEDWGYREDFPNSLREPAYLYAQTVLSERPISLLSNGHEIWNPNQLGFNSFYYANSHPEAVSLVNAGIYEDLYSYFAEEGIVRGDLPSAHGSLVRGTDAGSDLMLLPGNHADYTFIEMDDGKLEVTDSSSRSWYLASVERIAFQNTEIALDIDGSAGQTAKTLAAVIGAEGLSNKEYVGIGLQLFDAGQSLASVCELALTAVGATTHADVVNLLYTNLFGEAPTEVQAQEYISALDAGVFTKGSLAAAAAELTDDLGVIDLVGLAETGIEYV